MIALNASVFSGIVEFHYSLSSIKNIGLIKSLKSIILATVIKKKLI